MNFLISFLTGSVLRKLIRTALKAALKAYVQATSNKLDDTLYSMVIKIQDGKSIDDEVAFIINTYGGVIKSKIVEKIRIK